MLVVTLFYLDGCGFTGLRLSTAFFISKIPDLPDSFREIYLIHLLFKEFFCIRLMQEIEDCYTAFGV